MSDYTLKEELNLVELNLTTVKSLGEHSSLLNLKVCFI